MLKLSKKTKKVFSKKLKIKTKIKTIWLCNFLSLHIHVYMCVLHVCMHIGFEDAIEFFNIKIITIKFILFFEKLLNLYFDLSLPYINVKLLPIIV